MRQTDRYTDKQTCLIVAVPITGNGSAAQPTHVLLSVYPCTRRDRHYCAIKW